MLVTYPVLLRHLGAEAFGVFLLGIAISGMTAMVDFGFTLGIAKHVAEDIAKSDVRSAAEVIITGILACVVVGSIGAVVLWLIAPWLASITVSEALLRRDAVWVFRLAALQFPTGLITLALLALLKGMQRFDRSTLLLAALSALTYGGAAGAVLMSDVGLIGVSAIGVVTNILLFGLAIFMTRSLCGSYGIDVAGQRPTLAALKRLGRFGVFASMSSVAPVLSRQAHRIVIGALLGPAAVVIFAGGAMMASVGFSALRSASEVIMPATASVMHGAQTPAAGYRQLRRIYTRGLLASSALGLASMALLFAAAPIIVPWWLDSEIAGEVVTTVRILCIGMALNSTRLIPHYTLNGLGKPEFNAAFAMAGPIGAFGLVPVLAADGLGVQDFAIAFSASLSVVAIAQVLFTELFLWRRWVPRETLTVQDMEAVAA